MKEDEMKKKKKRLQIVLISLLVISVLILGAAIGYLIQDNGKLSSKTEKQNGSAENADVKDDQMENIVIHTEYGDLYYPEQWSEYLKTEQNRNNESLQVSFSAHLGDRNFPMFQVTIGESEDTEVGELADNSGTKRTVYMNVTELEGMEELSEMEQQQIYAMQEDLNYVIDHLK